MHDKNGKLIEKGAFVKLTTYINGELREIVGQVLQTKPEAASSCNVYIGVPYPSLRIREEYANAKDVEVVA